MRGHQRTFAGLTAFLALCLTVSCIALGGRAASALAEPKEKTIRWVDFKVPSSALDKAYQAALKAHGEGLDADMPRLLAALSARYWGNWSSYRAADLDKLMEELRKGRTIEELCAGRKDYPYFAECYQAVLGGMVGNHALALPDDSGEPRWTLKYGLKAYSPLAEGFGYSDCNDFGNARSFGYSRRHLGHDMMGTVGTPVVAVESGTVEALGWNRYGGWRIGIRSFDGKRYYYYAHLRKGKPFQPGLKEGDAVQAGDVIGYLGMTGYSDREDINGMKVPHLHFGMQLIFDESQKDGNGEIWIDVYQLTQFLRRSRSTVVSDGDGFYRRKYAYVDFSALGVP